MASKRWLTVTCATIVVTWTAWLLLAPAPWQTLAEHWAIAATMAFGSLIAGATCEGGGAVAFPVFTKVLSVGPSDAKWFALAIQSVGMTAAALTIMAMRRRIDGLAVVWAGLGGALGILLGAVFVAPWVQPMVVRILFTSLQCAFAVMLVMANRSNHTFTRASGIPRTNAAAATMVATGILGGLVSSLFGNGLDLVSFSVLVLLFRVDETIATPTTVVLMASNSLVGFSFGVWTQEYSASVYAYWVAAIPIVVVGAPVGAIASRQLSRETIVGMLVALIAIELVSTLWLIPFTLELAIVSIGGLALFVFSYWLMSRCSQFWPEPKRQVE